MSNVKDHSELPDFLSPQILARICVELSELRKKALRNEDKELNIRLEGLHQYYWDSLRSKVDLPEATRIINDIEV